MLTTSPHDCKAESLASLVNMLDPTAIMDPANYAHEDFRDKRLVNRRFKKNLQESISETSARARGNGYGQ